MEKPKSICFSPDSQLFAFLSSLGSMSIISMKKEIILSKEADKQISVMAFSQNSELFIYNISKSYVMIYNLKSKNDIFKLNYNYFLPDNISLTHDKYLLAYYYIGTLRSYVSVTNIFYSNNFQELKFEENELKDKMNIIDIEKSYIISGFFHGKYTRLLDIRIMRQQSVLVTKTKAKSLAFSTDNNWLAVGMNFKVKMVCISDNKKNWIIEAFGNVKSLKFSSDSHFLAFWSYPSIDVWDVLKKTKFFSVTYYFCRLITFDISRDNKYLAFGSEYCISVKSFDGEEKIYERESKSVWSVEYNKENVLIATGCSRTHIHILNVNQNQIIESIHYDYYVRGQEIYFIDRYLLVKLPDKVLKIHIETQHIVTLIQNFKSCSFSNDKKILLCYSNDGFKNLIDVENECSLFSYDKSIEQNISGLSAVCDKYFAVAYKYRIYLSDIEVLIDERKIIDNFYQLRPAYISKSKTYSIKPTDSSILNISDSKNPLNSYEIPTHSKHPNSIALSKDGQMIAFASNQKSIEVWNLKSREKLFCLFGHLDSIISLSFSFDGKSLVSGSWDFTVRMWNLDRAETNSVLYGHTNGVNFVCLDRTGKYLASSSLDRDTRVWDIEKREEVKRFTFGLSRSIAFDRRSKLIVVQVALYAKVYRFRV